MKIRKKDPCPYVKEQLQAKVCLLPGDDLEIMLADPSVKEDCVRNLIFLDSRNQAWAVIPLGAPKERKYRVSLKEFLTEAAPKTQRRSRFYLILEAEENTEKKRFLLTDPAAVEADPDLRQEKKQGTCLSFGTEIYPREYDDEWADLMAAAYVNIEGEWRLVLAQKGDDAACGIVCSLRRLSMHGKTLRMTVEVSDGKYRLLEIVLRFRSKLAEERIAFPFQVIKERKRNGNRILTLSLDLSGVPLKSLAWGVIAFFSDESDPACVCETTLLIPYAYRLYLSFLFHGKYKGEDGFFLYPYNNARGMLSFQYRQKNPADSFSFHAKEILAFLVYHIGKPYYRRKHIRLVFEKFCMMAQDNGFYFFRYCMEHREKTEKKAHYYYVLNRDSLDRENLLPYKDRVLDFLSIRHMIYLQAAEILISTDGRNHLYASNPKASILKRPLRKKPLVFLQHGVTAFKRVDFFYGKGTANSCDLFVVTSDFEKEIVRKHFGYREDEIANAGFARWDVLTDKSEGSREILIMPTWRAWLENTTEGEFLQSDYYRNYMQLLNTPRFYELLREHDLTACFYLHSKLRGFLTDFTVHSDRIRLVEFGTYPANELLMKCRLLITDYSSVSWDVLYQGKPVIFFQFDRPAYMEAHGSYVNFDTDLFGDCTKNAGELLEAMELCILDGMRLRPEYARMRERYFPMVDDQNSARICEAIDRKWG